MTIKVHNPTELPIDLDYAQFARELADAEYAIGLLEGLQRKLQNPTLLISPLSAKEAAVSSKIEGTQSTASDIFIHEAGGQTNKPDVNEVANYRRAIIYATHELEGDRPLSLHFIKRLHQVLLSGVRHRGRIGKFRDKQVWIAKDVGDPIERAIFIPPGHITIPQYMDNFMNYIKKSRDQLLVRVALMHYQFEAIHPFEDGNGRIGRLLIPLMLYYGKKLTLPIIYMSGFFEQNRSRYVSELHSVDEKGTYHKWIAFFLKAVAVQTQETQKLIENIYTLHDKVRDQFKAVKSPYIIPIIEHVFKSPVFSINDLVRTTGASRLTCLNLTRTFKAGGYVVELPMRIKKQKLYAFYRLLEIIR
jgi:Fic family protein